MCACGKPKMESMTANVAQALLDEARAQAKSETEAMTASAGQAVSNANSNASALR
jgi:hypothetical protein